MSEYKTQFKIGQIITLKGYISEKDLNLSFYYSGEDVIYEEVLYEAKINKKNWFGLTVFVTARVIEYYEYVKDKNCYKINVEFLNPFDRNKFLRKARNFSMLESEFNEFQEETKFYSGMWAYYLGAEAGGLDNKYWKKGMVGQVEVVEIETLKFSNKLGDMNMGGANYTKAFRAATDIEINEARKRTGLFKVGDWVYYMGAKAGGQDTGTNHWHEGIVGQIASVSDRYYFDKIGKMIKESGNSTPANNTCAFRLATQVEIALAQGFTVGGNDMMNGFGKSTTDISKRYELHDNSSEYYNKVYGNPCKEITLDLPEAFTMAMSLNIDKLGQEIEQDETKVSYQSKKLVANKIINSKEIENLLLIN